MPLHNGRRVLVVGRCGIRSGSGDCRIGGRRRRNSSSSSWSSSWSSRSHQQEWNPTRRGLVRRRTNHYHHHHHHPNRVGGSWWQPSFFSSTTTTTHKTTSTATSSSTNQYGRLSFASKSSSVQDHNNNYGDKKEVTIQAPGVVVTNENENGGDDRFLQLPEGMSRSVAIMTGAMFFNNLGFGCIAPVLPLYATSMGLGATGVGTILSTAAFARLVMNIPMGRLADQLGRKPLMVAGGTTVAVASMATGMATNLPTLLACRLLAGTGGSAATAGTGAYMADITSSIPDQRAKIAGVQNTVVGVAYAVGPAVGGYLCDLYGARTMFFGVGAANAICTMGYFLLPESSKFSNRTTTKVGVEKDNQTTITKKNVVTDDDTDNTNNESVLDLYSGLLRNPDRQGLLAMNFGIFCSYSALLTVFPLHAVEVLGSEVGTASTIGAMFAGASMIGFAGAPLGGYLADTIGRKKTIVPAALLVSAGPILIAAVTPETASLYTLFPSILLWGFGNSMVNPGLTAFAADIAKDEKTRSQALALSNSASDLSFLICPISLGTLAQLTDCSTAMVATGTVIGVLNLFFALRSTEPHPHEATTTTTRTTTTVATPTSTTIPPRK